MLLIADEINQEMNDLNQEIIIKALHTPALGNTCLCSSRPCEGEHAGKFKSPVPATGLAKDWDSHSRANPLGRLAFACSFKK